MNNPEAFAPVGDVTMTLLGQETKALGARADLTPLSCCNLPAGHQKKIMLAVKKLRDLRKSLNQAEATLARRKVPGALDIVTIESLENGECQSPHTPK